MGLSYTQLYDFVRKERSHQELQELPDLFYEEARHLLLELARESQQGSLLEAEQARVQLANTRKLLKQIYEYREEKLLSLAQSRCKTGSAMIDTARVLSAEQDLYDQLVATLAAQRTQLGIDELRQISPVRPPVPAREEERQPTLVESTPSVAHTTHITIRVVKPVPAFVGKDMQTFGPFAENEHVELPDAVAQVLIRRGNAERAE